MFCTGMASLLCGFFHVLLDFLYEQTACHKSCTGMASLQSGFFRVLVDFLLV